MLGVTQKRTRLMKALRLNTDCDRKLQNSNTAEQKSTQNRKVPILVTSSVVMCGPHFCSMKITEDVRKFAAQQKLSESEALKVGMEQKAREFAEAGNEIYSKAERSCNGADGNRAI